MHRHLFCLKRTISELRSNAPLSLIILFTLTVCTFSMLLCINALLYSTSYLKRMDQNLRGFYINASSSDCRELLLDLLDDFDNISKIENAGASPKGGGSGANSAKIYSSSDQRFAAELDIISGRAFSEEELSSGDNVIIWHNNDFYINSGMTKRYSVGDEISFGRDNYLIIGLSGSDSFITLQNAVNNENLNLRFSGVMFKNIPTEAEKSALNALAEEHGCTVESFSDKAFDSFLSNGLECATVMIFIIVCSVLILSQIFEFILRSRIREFGIYRVLGIDRLLLGELIFLPLLIFYLAALVSGWGLFRLSLPLQRALNMWGEVKPGVLAAVFGILLAVVFTALLKIAAASDFRQFRE